MDSFQDAIAACIVAKDAAKAHADTVARKWEHAKSAGDKAIARAFKQVRGNEKMFDLIHQELTTAQTSGDLIAARNSLGKLKELVDDFGDNAIIIYTNNANLMVNMDDYDDCE